MSKVKKRQSKKQKKDEKEQGETPAVKSILKPYNLRREHKSMPTNTKIDNLNEIDESQSQQEE